MSITTVCDYCGEPLEGDHATVHVSGRFADADDPKRSTYCSWDSAHYHTGRPDTDEPDCYWRVNNAVKLTQEMGPTLETIETISNQQLAARRRKHRKPAEEAPSMTDRERELMELHERTRAELVEFHERTRAVFQEQWASRAAILETIAAQLDDGDVNGAREFARRAAAGCRKAAEHIDGQRLTREEA